MAGKWHLGGTAHGGEGPHKWGFDRSYTSYTGGSNYWNAGVFHVDVHDPEVLAMVKSGQVPQEPITILTTVAAIEASGLSSQFNGEYPEI